MKKSQFGGFAVYLLLLPLIFLLNGCWLDDKRIELPNVPVNTAAFAPKSGTVKMGENYDERIYYNLKTGALFAIANNLFDISFESSATGFHVWLNEGQSALGLAIDSYDFTQPLDGNQTGLIWRPDVSSNEGDSTLVGRWIDERDGEGRSKVFLIDRGKIYHNNEGRFYKFQLLSYDMESYLCRLAPAASTNLPEPIRVAKTTGFSRVYLSFENGGKTVQIAPPDADWDLLFTRYTYIFAEEPLESPYRNYSVTGVLHHREKGVESVCYATGANGETPYDSLNAEKLQANLPQWKPNADAIGYDWKYYDLEAGYAMRKDWYFLTKTETGAIYKIRFVGFFDTQGVKGSPSFNYQRIY